MKPCKRIEIIIEAPMADKVRHELESLGVSGYTQIPVASGMGDRGTRREDDPTGTFTNCIFIVASENDEEMERIVAGIRPILSRSGGVCLVSDATWVKH